MATEWKNTKEKIGEFIKEHKGTALGIVFILIAIVGLCLIYRSFFWYYYSSGAIWLFGAAINGCLVVSNIFILNDYLRTHYKSWQPLDEDFYEEWKAAWGSQQRYIFIVGIAAFVGAFFYYFMTDRKYYYGNFAVGYVMLATVILQCVVAELVTIRFMKRKLGRLMDCMREINRKNLEEAIQIEKESMAQAAKSEQMKVDLISNVSHDLKTPLTSMVGYIELMKKEELTPVLADYVEFMSDKAEKLKEMIESLFSLAKASSGNIKLNLEEISLNMLIEQIFADMNDKITDSQLTFIKNLTDEDTSLTTDNLHMYRICQNLIENALKYSAKGTRVFLRTYVEKGELEDKIGMEITNTAGYFMDFRKEDIIERFARGDKARSSDGNGLGLAIVSTYTSALGGSFDINLDCDQFKASLTFPKTVRA